MWKKEKAAGGSPLMPLEDVVYAPLKALASSNAQLSGAAVEEIRRMGGTRYEYGEEVLFLKNISLAYERLHPTDDGVLRGGRGA